MPAPALIIHALGDWPAERLRCELVASGLRLPQDLALEVENAWAQARARPGVDLFDGPLCRLEGVVVDGDGLLLRLSPTSYRVFMGSNGRHPEWADTHGPQVMANAVGSSVVLLSADHQLVFGRRSQRVALYPGCAHPFGGTIEPPAPGAALDLLGEMRRELAEEVGIAPGDLADLRIIALVEDLHLRQPELVYAARTTLTAQEVAARLDQHEHTACWLLPDTQAAIDATLAGTETVTPVLAGALLTWGWRCFGNAWLDARLDAAGARLAPDEAKGRKA